MIIQIPETLRNNILQYIYEQYISYLNINLNDSDEKTILISSLSKKYNVSINKNIKTFKNSIINFNISKNDIPTVFRDIWKSDNEDLKFYLDWEQLKWPNRPLVGGSYNNNKFLVIINPRLIIDFVKNISYDLNDYTKAFEKPKYTLWHELTHMMQHRAIKSVDSYQVSKLTTGKEDNIEKMTVEYREKYLQNMIEYDPAIKTAVFKFKNKYENKIKNINDFKEFFNLFTLKDDLGKDNDF